MKNKSLLIKILIGMAIVLALALTIILLAPVIKYFNDKEALSQYLESFGFFMPIIYIILVLIQVIIPFIPGEIFEILAGYLFGSLWGMIIALFAESLASIIIILLVKKYGIKLVKIFFKGKDIDSIKFLNNKNLFYLYTLLFIIPGTPKDLLCYAGGLMKFDVLPLILVSTLGRIPSIVTSTIPGSALGDNQYSEAIIIYGITILLSIVGLFVYNKIKENRN